MDTPPADCNPATAVVADWTSFPLIGRASQSHGMKQIYLFASIAGVTGAPSGWNAEAEVPPGWQASVGGPQRQCERLWRLSTAGRAFVRASEEASLSPLEPGEFSQPPAGATPVNNGYFKVALDIARSTGNTRILIDSGQTLDIYAYSVEASLIAPGNAVEAVPGNRGTELRGGIVVDARIGASLLAVEESVSNHTAKLTQHVVVLSGTDVSIQIPRSAVGVKIYQSNAGVNSGDWLRTIGDRNVLGSAVITGVVSFASRASLDEHSPIGDETNLETDVDNLVDRFFTLVWDIRP